MPRTLTAPERTLLGGAHFVPHIRVQLENQAGGWQDMGAFMGRDYFVSTTWREGIDQPIASGTLVLSRRVAGESISPTMAAANANRPGGGGYDPFIRGRQKVRILQASAAPGVTPVFPTDYAEVFLGRIDNPDWGGRANQVTLPFSDQGAWLMSQQIDTLRTYSDATGQPLETVMQAILNDNPVPALAGITLHVPVATGINVKAFQQDRVPVMTALQTLAQQFAYDLRFRYDPADGISKLTLSLPDRDNDLSSPDWTFDGDEYLELPNIGINTDDVRTRGRVYYTDSATGAREFQEYTAPAPTVAEFGDIYFEIGEENTSNIDTAGEALNMITAAVKDLSAPKMSQRMETMFLWAVQLGDIAEFEPNGQHYDEAQTLAVVGIEHNLTRDSKRTSIDVRGNPAGAYSRWLALGASSGGAPTVEDHPARPQLSTFRDPDTGQVDAIVDVSADTATVKVAGHAGATPTIPTVADVRATAAHATGGARRVIVANVMTVSDTEVGYLSALAYDGGGNESPIASATVGTPTIPDATPSITLSESTPNPITGLTVDVGIQIHSPLNLGGVLRVWTNHDGTNNPNPAGPIEGAATIGATPFLADHNANFLVGGTGPGTFQYLNDIRVHPTQGKVIFAEFVDTDGNSSGQQSFVLNGGGGFLDENGNLKPGAIFTPSQIVDGLLTLPKFDPGLRVPVYSATLPTAAPAGGLVGSLTYYNGQLYKWSGSAWVNDVPAGNVVGTLNAAVIPTLTASSLDPTMRIPTVVGSLPGSGTSDQRVVFGGRLYKWNGSSWVDEAATSNLSGQVTGAQIASGAVGSTQIASSLTVPQAVTLISSANPAVSSLAFEINTGVLYRWIGGSWVRTTPAGDITGQIVSTQITDTAVTTAKIAALNITSALIASNAITAGKIAVDAVTAGTIAAAAITARELSANSVTAVKIAAGVITADKFFVSGGVGGALNADPACADPSAWVDDVTGFPPTATLTSGGKVGQTCFISPVGGPMYLDGRAMIPLDANKIYRVRVWLYGNGVNGQFYCGVRMFRGDGAEVVGGGGGAFYTSYSPTIADGWTQYVGYLGTGQTTTGQTWTTDFGAVGGVNCRMYALVNYLGTGSGQCLIQDFRLEEVLPGTLIQDGAITTAKITAGAITAGTIAANAVTAGKVAAGAIGADQLQANSVTAVKILAGSITSDKLFVSGGFGQALNADPALTDPTAWPINNFAFVDFGTGGQSGRYGIRSNASAFASVVAAQAIPFDVNKVYRFRLWVRRSPDANGVVYYGGTFKNGDGTDSNSNSGYCYAAGSGTPPSGSLVWQEFVGFLSVSGGSVASTARFFYPIIYLNYGASAGFMDAQDFRVEEVLPGTLIQDGVITTAKIAALAITSNELAANAATFGKVAAGAISAAQIQTDAVTAVKIAAGAIQADKLIITMGAGGAINIDPYFSDPSAWTIIQGGGNPSTGAKFASMTSGGMVGSTAILSSQTPGDITTAVTGKQIMRLDWAHKTFRVHAWVYNGGADGPVYLGLNCFRKSDGASMGGVYATGLLGGGLPPAGWSELVGNINAAQFTAWGQDATVIDGAQALFYLNYTGTTGYYWIQDFRIEEVMPGTLIKDGSILTQHLTSTTVTAAVVSVGSLQSLSANMGILTSGKLQGPSGMYLDLNATGGNPVLHGSQFDLYANGAASFRGDITGASGTFSGALSAASGSFAGDITGATGTFSGAIGSSSFTTGNADFAGKIQLRGTLRIVGGGTGYEEDGLGGLRFDRYDFGYTYGKIYLDASVAAINIQANAGVNLDAGTQGVHMTGQDKVTIMRTFSGTSSVFEVANDSAGNLFIVDVPTNNNDTGLQVIYKTETGALVFRRLRGDNTNTGGSGNRNIRILN